MKFTCSQQSLSKALTTVSKAVTNRTTIPILKGILLKTTSDGNLTLSASDLDMSIEKKIDVNVEKEGSVVVLSKLFSDIIRKLPNEQILIEEKENNTNNEIEDFVYPEVMCYLVNEILKKKGMNIIKTEELILQLSSQAFKGSGFMSVCDFYKNSANPQTGAEISFVSSGQATNQLKESLAGVFELEGNKKLLKIVEEADKKYPYVKTELIKLSKLEIEP